MARPRTRYNDTIEYIGARPQKPKRRNFFGGWVIIVIALGMGFWFGKPLMPFLQASQAGVSEEQADSLIFSLRNSKSFGHRLAATALAQSDGSVTYDPSYYKMPYPNGDAPVNKGVAADVIVRAYRGMDMDLQALVHEDMTENFRLYPQLWGASAPDSNIDHRRVPNLLRFFERKGQTLTPSRNLEDYIPGDLVIWSLANAESHIGIIVPGPGNRKGEAWVVHHLGTAGVKWENCLLDYSIQRHFRFPTSEGE
jgi:uncharacterized protein